MKNWTPRITAYLLGLIILALGIALVIRAGIGTGAWDALNVGLSYKVGLTVGSWLIIIGVTLVFINAFLLRESPDFPAIATVLIIGFLVDGWLYLIRWQPDVFWTKLILFLIGMLVTAMGLAVYLQAKFAPTSIDKFMYAIAKRTGLSLQISKTIGELLALVFAWLVDGPIGLGTILITFLIGPLLQFFLPLMEPLFYPSLKRSNSS